MDASTIRRLDDIERRLAQIEGALRLSLPTEPVAPAPPDLGEAPAIPPPLPDASFAAGVPASVQTAPIEPTQVIPYRPVTERAPAPGLEQLIGLKWAGWVGAVVLVIGAALGFKFAYDQGWLGLLPDSGKLAAMSLAGFALIGAGEFVLRRINRLSAAGLYGAGVAILFLVSYAGYAWYGLFAYDVAIALSGVSALLGVLLAARSDLISIAALAILGGAIAPASIGPGDTPIASLCLYLMALQLMALALCFWRRDPKWWALRGLSLACVGTWMTGFVAWRPDAPVVLTFSLLIAALYHLELIVTARRHRETHTEQNGGIVFSMLVTALFVACLMILHRDASDTVRGTLLLITAGVCAAMGFLLLIGRRAEWIGLSRSLRVQAVALVTFALPVFLDGPSLVIGWTILALMLATLGRLAKLRISLVATAIVWALAAGAWAVWALDPFSRHLPDAQMRWMVALWVCVAGHGCAVLIRAAWPTATSRIRSVTDPTAMILHVLASALWAVASLQTMSRLAACVAIAAYALALLSISLLPALRMLIHLAAAMLMGSAAVWFTAAVFPGDGASRVPAFFNLYAGVGVLLAMLAPAMGAAYARLAPSTDETRALRLVLIALLPVMLLLVGSVEIDRYASTAGRDSWIIRQVGWSIWWAVLGAGCIIAGFVTDSRIARLAGLALIGVTLVKLVIVDLSGVGTGWRIVSFIALGAVLLGTSVLYGKFGDRSNTTQRMP